MPAFSDNHESEEFIEPTIDIGCVVSNIEASVKFYTKAIGFKVAGGFKVPSDFAESSGLTKGKELDIEVLTLGGAEGEEATKLKLMQVKGSGGKADQMHIDSTSDAHLLLPEERKALDVPLDGNAEGNFEFKVIGADECLIKTCNMPHCISAN